MSEGQRARGFPGLLKVTVVIDVARWKWGLPKRYARMLYAVTGLDPARIEG